MHLASQCAFDRQQHGDKWTCAFNCEWMCSTLSSSSSSSSSGFGLRMRRPPVATSGYQPLRGAGLNIVNLLWERIAEHLGETDDADHNTTEVAWQWRHMADEASRHHHNLTVLASHGVDLVRFAAAPYCPNHFALWRLVGPTARTTGRCSTTSCARRKRPA